MSTKEPAGARGRIYEFGVKDRVRVARESAGYDQEELAQEAGLSRATISNYERGNTERKSGLLLIAMATGFDRDWLRTGKTEDDDDGPKQPVAPAERATSAGVSESRDRRSRRSK